MDKECVKNIKKKLKYKFAWLVGVKKQRINIIKKNVKCKYGNV